MSYNTRNIKNSTSFTVLDVNRNTTFNTSNTEKDTTWSVDGVNPTSLYNTTEINASSSFLFFTNFVYNNFGAKWNEIQTIWGR